MALVPDPVLVPSATEDPDPKRVSVLRGLPEGVSRAEVVYRARGRLGDRAVRRSRAEFATLVVPGAEVQQLAVADADKYLAEANRRAAAQDAGLSRWWRSLDVSCPCTGRPRRYRGTVLIDGIAQADPPVEPLRELRQHVYLCDWCGSTVWYADGFVRHPLPSTPG